MPRYRTNARSLFKIVAVTGSLLVGCSQVRPIGQTTATPNERPASTDSPDHSSAIGEFAPRVGDEIMVAGQLVHTGSPVVLWFDPPVYDAYRVEKRFARAAEASWEASAGSLDSPNRYGERPGKPEDGWTPQSLAPLVDQFVLHYDATGLSRTTFKVLQDIRGLSVHFMIDLDGTIYQTLDVKERAWHATIANDRSVGVEIANIGAYPDGDPTLRNWYRTDASGTWITLPPFLGNTGIRDPLAPRVPSRPDPITGTVNGETLTQYDLTDAQYESLARLSAALCTVLPRIRPDAPRDAAGRVINKKLTEEAFGAYSGILGHFHVQSNKVDPGPAFDWERLIRETRAHMGLDSAQRSVQTDLGG